ncbi:MarR family transcriptional regulator [Pontixanthobacter aestiaquae]|uniref:MarR family transcriptional regulator n=1 Tax=Pontixanthobacter aestiaquae TaxID=1509367 RepID=A0A844Z7G7_9SPHN|nr:MarR family transcriptional regulator [Pontixanthobacter aestiaquae]MDN3645980.1 MarR family transcriptional regulator [Pontixanthobacter aestiaquae]MXO83027.1 MarR family transcriptional regulator [Pontixanthobacter aestiaquae]
MAQADFQYHPTEVVRDAANDAAGVPVAVSIFADRAHIRDTIADDACAAGLRLGQVGDVADLLGGAARPLGEVVVLDCPVINGRRLAAIARLDARAANSGAHLIVSTSVDALDDVFGCLDQSNPQLLVDPGRGERVIALGRVLAKMPNMRLRDLSDEDRLSLIRLTEQVGQIAERLERLGVKGQSEVGGAFRFESPLNEYGGEEAEDGSDRLVRKPRPAMPDPRLVRRIIRQRQLRARFFDKDLFADPAWDILLDLTAARAEHMRVSVTSLCIASGVPPTTALRWISQMVDAGLLDRVEDETDKRRAFIALSDRAADAMARYFAEVGKEASYSV